MPQIFYYLLKVIVCSGILFGYYHLFLRNKVYHAYNRFYLLTAVVLSLTVPLLNFNISTGESVIKQQPIQILEVVNSSDQYLADVIIDSHKNNITGSEVLLWTYALVSFILLCFFIKLLARIYRMIQHGEKQHVNDIVFINSTARGTPFSFFRYLFWNAEIDIHTETGKQIFSHELAHIRERHSVDKIFINLLLVLFWCNPVFWLIRKELNLIHEFIADKRAVGAYDTAVLASMIMHTAYPQHNFSLTNHFFYSPIKRRLQMLSNYKKTKAGYFGRLLALPLVLLLAAAFTLKTKKISDPALLTDKPFIVVIDAGHGGQDEGAIWMDEVTEKDINLKLAKKIKELNTNRKINIILTRETDIYQTPQDKAAFAAKEEADLFISIHVSSGPKAVWDKATGMEVFVSRDEFSNSLESKVFASAIIATFRDNYGLPVQPNPMQRPAGIYVLQKNTFPSVIIEAGYISNKKDRAYLNTGAAKEIFAKNILTAIDQYRSQRNLYAAEPITAIDIEAKRRVDTPPTYTGILKKIQNDIYVDASQEKRVPNNKHLEILRINYKDFTREDEPLYIINGKEAARSQAAVIEPAEIRDIRVFTPATAMPTYGAKARNGAIIINTSNGSVASAAASALSQNQNTQDPVVTLSGIRKTSIHIDELKNIKELKTTLPDYTVVSATLYFSGAGFPEVVTAQLNGESLEKTEMYLKRVKAGTTLTFDNIQVQKKDGSGRMTIEGKGFSFYDNPEKDQ